MDSRLWWTISAWAQNSMTVLNRRHLVRTHRSLMLVMLYGCVTLWWGPWTTELKHHCDGPTFCTSYSFRSWAWWLEVDRGKKKNIQYHTSSTGQSRAPLTISKCHQIKSNLTFVTTTIPLGSQFQDIFKYMVSFFPSVNSSGECMVIYIKSQKPPHVGKNSFAFSRSISTHLVLPLVEYWKQSRMKWGI